MSGTHSTCPWKGVASYYDIVVGDTVNADAIWYYPSPKAAAEEITGWVASQKRAISVCAALRWALFLPPKALISL